MFGVYIYHDRGMGSNDNTFPLDDDNLMAKAILQLLLQRILPKYVTSSSKIDDIILDFNRKFALLNFNEE